MIGPIKKQPRLGQWDGRRRSSRSDEPVLPRLWRRPALLRLGAVLAVAVTATLLAHRWAPPPRFRVGQCPQHDLRARVHFEVGIRDLECIIIKDERTSIASKKCCKIHCG